VVVSLLCLVRCVLGFAQAPGPFDVPAPIAFLVLIAALLSPRSRSAFSTDPRKWRWTALPGEPGASPHARTGLRNIESCKGTRRKLRTSLEPTGAVDTVLGLPNRKH
jgi:hypothetical protein